MFLETTAVAAWVLPGLLALAVLRRHFKAGVRNRLLWALAFLWTATSGVVRLATAHGHAAVDAIVVAATVICAIAGSALLIQRAPQR